MQILGQFRPILDIVSHIFAFFGVYMAKFCGGVPKLTDIRNTGVEQRFVFRFTGS